MADTVLGNYSSLIECRCNGGEGQVVASGAGTGPLAVEVTNGADDPVRHQRTCGSSVGIEKTNDAGDPATVEPGEVIGFTLTVTVSNGTATNVIVTDLLPDGLTYVSDSAEPAIGLRGRRPGLTLGGRLALRRSPRLRRTTPWSMPTRAETSTNLGCVDADQNDGFILFEVFGSDEEDIPCSTTPCSSRTPR